jgi:hypothetical protein
MKQPDDDNLDSLANAWGELQQGQKGSRRTQKPAGFVERWLEADRKEDEKYAHYLFPAPVRAISDIVRVVIMLFVLAVAMWIIRLLLTLAGH